MGDSVVLRAGAAAQGGRDEAWRPRPSVSASPAPSTWHVQMTGSPRLEEYVYRLASGWRRRWRQNESQLCVAERV